MLKNILVVLINDVLLPYYVYNPLKKFKVTYKDCNHFMPFHKYFLPLRKLFRYHGNFKK